MPQRLPLGNGEFCFGADATGLQTFAGNSMSHWGWHSFPLPKGWTPDRVPSTGTFQKGRNTGGHVLVPGDILGLKRTLDLWSGVQTSHYRRNGQDVNVETCVHPNLDMLAVRIESPLVAKGELEVTLDFAYPSLKTWISPIRP